MSPWSLLSSTVTSAAGRRNGADIAKRRGPRVGPPPAHGCAPALWPSAFSLHRDPKFLWLGDHHGEAFEALRLAVVRRAPLMLLTGRAGTGTTMLAEAVAGRVMDDGKMVGRLPHPSRDVGDFWTAVAAAFGPLHDAGSREAPGRFVQHVEQAARSSLHMVLVIDEAQALTTAVLREVSRACDLARDAGGPGVLTVLLVGHEELDALLTTASDVDLAGRIAVRRRLRPLLGHEVTSYVQHRLRCIGARPDVFTPEALTAIAVLSHGVPRLVNTVCAQATASGRIVDAALVRRCESQLAWVPDDARRPARWAAEPDHMRRRRLGRGVVTATLAATGLLALTAANGAHRPSSTPRVGATPTGTATSFTAVVPAPPPTAPAPRADNAAAQAPRPGAAKEAARGRGASRAATPAPAAIRARPAAPGTPVPRPAGEAAAGAGGDTDTNEPDPRLIIDWLLETDPTSRPLPESSPRAP
jgi:general secretion pathway protein A